MKNRKLFIILPIESVLNRIFSFVRVANYLRMIFMNRLYSSHIRNNASTRDYYIDDELLS